MIDTPWAFCELFVKDGRLWGRVSCRTEEIARASQRFLGCGAVRRRKLLVSEGNVGSLVAWLDPLEHEWALRDLIRAYERAGSGVAKGIALGTLMAWYKERVDRVQNV